MTAKTSVAYRLSDQALENLEYITQATGSNKTAVIEMSLALLASQLKGETMIESMVSELDHAKYERSQAPWGESIVKWENTINRLVVELARARINKFRSDIAGFDDVVAYMARSYDGEAWLDVVTGKLTYEKPKLYNRQRDVRIFNSLNPKDTTCLDVYLDEYLEMKELTKEIK